MIHLPWVLLLVNIQFKIFYVAYSFDTPNFFHFMSSINLLIKNKHSITKFINWFLACSKGTLQKLKFGVQKKFSVRRDSYPKYNFPRFTCKCLAWFLSQYNCLHRVHLVNFYFMWTLLCIMLTNGKGYFKNLATWTKQDF